MAQQSVSKCFTGVRRIGFLEKHIRVVLSRVNVLAEAQKGCLFNILPNNNTLARFPHIPIYEGIESF
jgi:hypothetical protein